TIITTKIYHFKLRYLSTFQFLNYFKSFISNRRPNIAKSMIILKIITIFDQITPLMQNSILLSGTKFQITIQRLCHQLIENHQDFSNSVIVGIQPRGGYLANRIVQELKTILQVDTLQAGELDITFFRDDFRMKGSLPLSPS